METWGLCPWHVPAAPQKKCEHTFLIQRKAFLSVMSPASSCCCSFTSNYFAPCCFLFMCVGLSVSIWMAGQTDACVYVYGRKCVWYCVCVLALWHKGDNAMLGWSLACISRPRLLLTEIHPSIECSLFSLPVLGWDRLDWLHASCICMLHEHNLLTPSGTSFRPFALFLRSYAKWTNLWS